MASQLEEAWKVRQNEIEAYRFQGLEHYARAMMREKLEKSQRRREKKRAKQRQPWKNSHHPIEIITCSVPSFQLPFIQTFCLSYFPTLQLACEECFGATTACMYLFISHLASWLRTRRFSEPTLRPSGATNHWKNTVFRDFPTFSRAGIFFLLSLYLFWYSFSFCSLLWLSAFHVSILSEVWLLNFLRLYIAYALRPIEIQTKKE